MKSTGLTGKQVIIAIASVLGAIVVMCCCVGAVANIFGNDSNPNVKRTPLVSTKTPSEPTPIPTVTVTPSVEESKHTNTSKAPKPIPTTPNIKETTKKPEPKRTEDDSESERTEDDTPSYAYYKNCSEVRAAGKAPLYKGQPGYRSGLDRDGDGVACE